MSINIIDVQNSKCLVFNRIQSDLNTHFVLLGRGGGQFLVLLLKVPVHVLFGFILTIH